MEAWWRLLRLASWLSSAQAAEYLNVHPATLRKLTSQGSIRFEQDAPNSKLYFEAERLDEWRRAGGGNAA